MWSARGISNLMNARCNHNAIIQVCLWRACGSVDVSQLQYLSPMRPRQRSHSVLQAIVLECGTKQWGKPRRQQQSQYTQYSSCFWTRNWLNLPTTVQLQNISKCSQIDVICMWYGFVQDIRSQASKKRRFKTCPHSYCQDHETVRQLEGSRPAGRPRCRFIGDRNMVKQNMVELWNSLSIVRWM